MRPLAAGSGPIEAPSRLVVPRLLAAARALGLAARWICQVALVAAVELVLAATLPGVIGFHNVTITGGSMGGALPVGSVAVTRTIAFSDVRIGDVIALKHPATSIAVVHRVVEIHESDAGRTAVTRGDANADNDPEPLALAEGHGDRVVVRGVPGAGRAAGEFGQHACSGAGLGSAALRGRRWSLRTGEAGYPRRAHHSYEATLVATVLSNSQSLLALLPSAEPRMIERSRVSASH